MPARIQNKIRIGKHLRCSYWIGGLSWAVSIWWFLFPPPQTTVEYWFSRRWYRWILSLIAPLTQSTGFPIALALVFAGSMLFLIIWARKWTRIRRVRHSHWAGLFWGIRNMLLCIPVFLVWFIIFWGAGYRRLPVEKRLHFDTAPVSESEAGILRDLLLEQVKRNAIPAGNRDEVRAVKSIASAMALIVAEWDECKIDLPCRVKPVPKGLLLSSGTSGVCAPFTLEALVDRGLPETAFVYSAAHELGHVAGFCPEDEASFAGYISGMRADDGFARYACALSAYMDLISRLKPEDFEKAVQSLPEAARQDLANADKAYRRYHVRWFSRISWSAYDHYLQAQGIKEGVQNYSHGITLLAYAWRKGMLNTVASRQLDIMRFLDRERAGNFYVQRASQVECGAKIMRVRLNR
jgi:hypothetical protein